ncbi:hypothetical protein PSYAR_31441, partial [Pseudomonas syringae pv. aceris str. M302273]
MTRSVTNCIPTLERGDDGQNRSYCRKSAFLSTMALTTQSATLVTAESLRRP